MPLHLVIEHSKVVVDLGEVREFGFPGQLHGAVACGIGAHGTHPGVHADSALTRSASKMMKKPRRHEGHEEIALRVFRAFVVLWFPNLLCLKT